MIKRIGVLTSGGGGSGVNAAIRAVVRAAVYNKLEVLGIIRGYQGLLDDDIITMTKRSVSGIINRGGTILKTARCDEFKTYQGQKKAVSVLKKQKIDGLIVIGGEGSFKGAHILATNWKIPTIGVPATIDNDVNGTDFSIGSDTAINTALDAIDKIRDTVTSMERIFVIEVMGRTCGYIATYVALAGGAEEVIVPEAKYDINKICDEIRSARKEGKISWILIVAEGAAGGSSIADIISKKTGFETRVTVLGHIQRGGIPTARDRMLASRMGEAAVKLLIQGQTDKMTGIIAEQIEPVDLSYAVQKRKGTDKQLYKLIKILAI